MAERERDLDRPAVGPREEAVPPVVAVVVTRDPGPWFEETLQALADQDYSDLSVLVVISGGSEDPTARVAAILPNAFVRRLDEDRGFGVAIDEGLGMVNGAAFFLLCHDDCAPDPDAVHLLVEESFRSNAGVLGPKQVRWHEPTVLLHVGINADKSGAVVERVLPGEVDHGQHDAVRDVFALPGGCTLVRADLLAELGGYDQGNRGMAEDLDLCWRAQVAGARILIVPDARCRHLEATAAGLRDIPGAETLQALQRRHELRAVLSNYSLTTLVRVLPQAILLALGEIFVSLVVGERRRSRAVTGAWRWNFRHLGEIRQRRRKLAALRALPDHEVRVLQLRGFARLSTYLTRLIHNELDVAHGRTTEDEVTDYDDAISAEPALTGSVGLAFSEDADFDDLDDLGHRSGRDRYGNRRRVPMFSTRRARLVLWGVVTLLWLIGSRNLFGGALPLLGQFVSFPSWTGSFAHLVSGWHSAGLGGGAPASPGFGVLGLAGIATLGHMGILQKAIVLGAFPVGAWGCARIARPFGSRRASMIAGIGYLALPLAYNSLAGGRFTALVAYADLPWAVAILIGACGIGRATPRPIWHDALTLAAVAAPAVALAPPTLVALLVIAVAFSIGSLLVGESGARPLVITIAAGVILAVLFAPWTIGVLVSGHAAADIFGLPVGKNASIGFGEALRFHTGPMGGTIFSWLPLVAGLLPLVIGRSIRLAWAGRLWIAACLSWVLVIVVSRDWTGGFAPTVAVLLVPAGIAVAASIGLGIGAIEIDLVGYHFGWRQAASVIGVIVTVAAGAPAVAGAVGGRWGLDPYGYNQAMSFPSTTGANSPGSYRVLWLGTSRSLLGGGWPISQGLSFETSEGGFPSADELFSPASPGPATQLVAAVLSAGDDRTRDLGRLLAPAAVRYVVVVGAIAPQLPGVQSSPSVSLPGNLLSALEQQTDLVQVSTSENGYNVFENVDALPQRAVRPTAPIRHSRTGSTSRLEVPTIGDLSSWSPVLPGPAAASRVTGTLPIGTFYSSAAPGGGWHLTVAGRNVPAAPAFGWASQYAVVAPGRASFSFATPLWAPLSGVLELGLWALAALALIARSRRGGLQVWLRRSGRHTRARSATTSANAPTPVEALIEVGT